jgi:hypothetical protein
MRRFPNRRRNHAQRATVDRLTAEAVGDITVLRIGDGSVFVYDLQRDERPPVTVRRRVAPDGEVDVAERFGFSGR